MTDTRAYAEEMVGTMTDIKDRGNLMCGKAATKNSSDRHRAVRKSLNHLVEENSLLPSRRKYTNRRWGNIVIQIIVTILQVIIAMTCGQWWQ